MYLGLGFSVRFIHSEKATKFCKIFTLLFSYVLAVKSKVKTSQNFVAFSEYMNFMTKEFELPSNQNFNNGHHAVCTQCIHRTRPKL